MRKKLFKEFTQKVEEDLAKNDVKSAFIDTLSDLNVCSVWTKNV